MPAALQVNAGAQGVASAATTVVPSQPSSTGPMALADYDGDGDARSVRRRTRDSRAVSAARVVGAYRNIRGTYVLDTANTRMLKDVGMVSAAMFADIDGDGHPDLVLAREWGSILVLLNRNGSFVPAPDSWGFNKWTSRWIGIAAGDLDGDGKLDLVATSWGRNVPRQGRQRRSALSWSTDRSAPNGEVEMLLAQERSRAQRPGAAQQLRACEKCDAGPGDAHPHVRRLRRRDARSGARPHIEDVQRRSAVDARQHGLSQSRRPLRGARRCRSRRSWRRRRTPASPTSTATATKTSS